MIIVTLCFGDKNKEMRLFFIKAIKNLKKSTPAKISKSLFSIYIEDGLKTMDYKIQNISIKDFEDFMDKEVKREFGESFDWFFERSSVEGIYGVDLSN